VLLIGEEIKQFG